MSFESIKKIKMNDFSINDNKNLPSFQNFGQSEKLTDRIKSLLKGYKDGYSIFKETIQNADDANASIVKFCYDKRSLKDCKDPCMMMDENLAQAQLPSLWIL
jgi:sacsin